jgi:proteasome beta subunit
VRDPFRGPPLFSPSFVDVVRAYAPDLLAPPPGTAGPMPQVPEGTTVAAARFADGVVMGGDRRATEGTAIVQNDIEKVFPADHFSAVAIAGAAGPATEMVRLFQTELEHYEKVEGLTLSLEGKANKLSQMVRGNLPMALQGLVVVPLFCGYDERRKTGRIFRYDVTGGRFEDTDFHALGSGGRDARGSLKKRYRHDMDGATAVAALVEALYDAAEEDAATGGPDLVRGTFPVVATVTADGYQRLPDDEVRGAAERVVAARARGEG